MAKVILEITEIFSVIGTAAAPVGELRVAIPLAVVKFNFAWYQAIWLAILGNLIPVVIVPWVLYRLGYIIYRLPGPIRGPILWRTQKMVRGKDSKLLQYGAWALVPFVAIPLPFTGAWTGCLLAWALDIHPRRSQPFLALGVLVAAVLVTALTEAGVSLKVLWG